jgi:DNA polymerase I-like protein with 3'-5' exonuclease and polymerase domains
VSEVYESLGIKDILSDDAFVKEYFGDYDLILGYIDQIRKESKGSGKSKDMETLAFHMLTMPEIKELK